MIRVGFVLEDSSWLGGVNYFRNLFSAIRMNQKSRLRPVMFVASNSPSSVLDRLQHCEIVSTSLLNRRSVAAIARKLIRRITDRRDLLLAQMLINHRIDILSHGASLEWPRRIRTIGWIPDFQHLHLPRFFDDDELLRRDREFTRIADKCDRVVLSSSSAQQDFVHFAPHAAARSRVLRFIPEIDFDAAAQPISILERKFQLDGPYFFLPNQFWVHKNHSLVVSALNVLRHRGIRATVIATGNTSDPRSANHFASLMQEVERLDLTKSFRVLGVVGYSDMLSLMKNSLAVINPSLFEGWSSTVEEAKVLRQIVLLSDLPVHREQNPDRGIFFDPNNPDDLANAMSRVLSTDLAHIGDSKEDLARYQISRMHFAANYEEIVLELMDSAVGSGHDIDGGTCRTEDSPT